MPVYRLAPAEKQKEHPKWVAAELRDTCWVHAIDANEARLRVHLATLEFMAKMRGLELPFSPWVDSGLTTCTEDDSHTDVPDDGTVVRADGRSYP